MSNPTTLSQSEQEAVSGGIAFPHRIEPKVYEKQDMYGNTQQEGVADHSWSDYGEQGRNHTPPPGHA